jgi:hypothetical protein
MLTEPEQQAITSIINQTLISTEYFNNMFSGFEIYITGSSLNLVSRTHNDIDLMIVVPAEQIRKSKLELMTSIWNLFKNNDLETLAAQKNSPQIRILGLTDLLNSLIDFINYIRDISSKDSDALYQRLQSTSEINRLLMDPEAELAATRIRAEGLSEEEKNVLPLDSDGAVGYQFGKLVEEFLNHVVSNLTTPEHAEGTAFSVKWSKSFSEGYGKIAGENNCYIFSTTHHLPVHIFLTTGVDHKKAMEKKESFMLEYYTEQERMQPIRIY